MVSAQVARWQDERKDRSWTIFPLSQEALGTGSSEG